MAPRRNLRTSRRIQRSSNTSQPFFQPAFSEAERTASAGFFTPAPVSVQTKLSVGQPGDKYEQEADRVADQVVNQTSDGANVGVQRAEMKEEEKVQRAELKEEEKIQKVEMKEEEKVQRTELKEEEKVQRAELKEEEKVQRACAECEKEKEVQRSEDKEEEKTIQASGTGAGMTVSPNVSSRLQARRGQGSPMPANTQREMASSFGQDFGQVRIHTDSEAETISQNLNAHAFTLGRDIYFNSGKFSPETQEGKRLLAHELVHVRQQDKADQEIQRKIGDGHDLTSPRLKNNALFEAIFDNQAVIELGARGQEVRRLQQMLIDLGISLPKFGADGDFGAETKKAVKEFQRKKSISVDGRVGVRTLTALNLEFPAFGLPSKIKDPWSMSCILEVLCPWNKNLVTKILPGFSIVTFDSRTFPTETWDGAKWVKGTFSSGGFQGGKNMGFLNSATCEEMAFTIYHEGWHGQQPSGMTGVVEAETDAYINAEQWSIDVGISGQGSFTNNATGATESFRKPGKGETVVNEPAAKRFVKQEYGGVSAKPGERVLARVGADQVKVRRPDGSEYIRLATKGESIRGAVSMTNLKPISPTSWVCP